MGRTYLKKGHLFLISGLICLFIVGISTPSFAYDVLLGTDKIGSFSHFVGRTICRTINNYNEDINCRPVPASSMTSTLTNLQSGSLDLALVNSKMIFDARSNLGFFRYLDIRYDDLRFLLPIYRQPVSLVVRQDASIENISDLRGKSVNGGEPFSLTHNIMVELLREMGWSFSDLGLYQNLPSAKAQDTIAFNSGRVQAMLHIGVHPDKALKRKMINGRGKLIAINKNLLKQMTTRANGMCSSTIPADYYENGTSRNTLALETILITTTDADDELVGQLLSALLEQREQLQLIHPTLLSEELDLEKVCGAAIPAHSSQKRHINSAGE